MQSWLFFHLAWLVNTSNPYGYLPFILLATELNDVAAFTVGRLFGKHPMRPNVSPKKTWEGAIGAVVFSMILPFALWFTMPELPGWKVALLGLIVGGGGQLGDLSVSAIKRDLGVKDLGSAIPGHGGVLDRIDSLTFVAPLFVYLIGP